MLRLRICLVAKLVACVVAPALRRIVRKVAAVAASLGYLLVQDLAKTMAFLHLHKTQNLRPSRLSPGLHSLGANRCCGAQLGF